MELWAVFLLACAALPSGQQARWPWDTALRPAEAKMFEQVVVQGKGRSVLSHLLRPPFGKSIGMAQVKLFLRSKSLGDGGYTVVDEAVRREALLEKAWTAASKRDKADAFRGKAEAAYHSLKVRLRLALAFGRAAVARRMAAPETASYSSQAIESAIDSTRDAARHLEFVEKQAKPRAGQVTSAQLWDLYGKLLDVWEKSKKQDNIGLIRSLDMQELVEKCIQSHGTFDPTD